MLLIIITIITIICRSATNTSRSTELLRRRFAEPGLSQNATQPTSRRPRYNDDDRHDDDDNGHGTMIVMIEMISVVSRETI